MTKIALVVLDTLRKDYFDKHFDWLSGRRFENAWSTSHWTVPAHATLFTGMHPSEAGVHAKSFYYPHDLPTIPAKLPPSYESWAYTANPNISPHFQATKDFDHVVGSQKLTAMGEDIFNWDKFIQEHLNDGPLRFLKAIKECMVQDVDTLRSLKCGLQIKLEDMHMGEPNADGGKKFLKDIQGTTFPEDTFLFMNLMEAHAPYNPPEEYGAPPNTMEGLRFTFGETPDADIYREAYDASVRYLSDVYRDIFHELKKDFDTIVTVSDHGELLGEHGGWEHLYGIFPELTHVPLVVNGDSLDLPDGVVNFQDIHHAIVGEEVPDRDVARVEYHGLNENNRIGAENKGLTIPSYMDKQYVGVATRTGYAYESFLDGLVVDGDVDGAEKLVEENHFNLEEGDTSVSDELKSHLEDLGYA